MSKVQKSNETEQIVALPPLVDGEIGTVTGAKVLNKATNPPSPYTEGTLLNDMEGASKYVEDPELRKILKSISGLGTAATRAAIIETLKAHKYLEKSGKNIVSTDKGIRFVNWGKSISPDLFDVAQTAKWQAKLQVLEASPGASRQQFETEVESFVKQTVAIFKQSTALGGGTPSENQNMNSRAPTEKMLEFAKKIADKTGKKLTDEIIADFEVCKEFIDANKDAANAPSPKQISFAESIAKSKGLTLPEDVRKDSKAISNWINDNK